MVWHQTDAKPLPGPIMSQFTDAHARHHSSMSQPNPCCSFHDTPMRQCRQYQADKRQGMLPWRPLLVPLNCYLILLLYDYNSFEDRVPADFIYGYPNFKRAALIWYRLKDCSRDSSSSKWPPGNIPMIAFKGLLSKLPWRVYYFPPKNYGICEMGLSKWCIILCWNAIYHESIGFRNELLWQRPCWPSMSPCNLFGTYGLVNLCGN